MTSTQLAANESRLIIDDYYSFYNPNLYAKYLIDDENQLNIHQILNTEYQEKFNPNIQGIPQSGLASSNIWFKFTVQNLLDTSPYLELDNPALDTLQYFLFNKDGKLVHQITTGNYKRIQEREIRNGQLIIDLHLNQEEVYTCYIKVNSKSSSIMMPMKIASLKKLYEINYDFMIWQGIYFGLVLFIFIYNLFLYISLQDLSHLFFAMFIACIGLMFTLIKGLGMNYMWNDFPEFNRLTPLLGAASGIFIILFTAQFLNSRLKTPKMHVWLLALVGFYLIVIGLNVSGAHFLSLKILEYNSIIVLFFLLFVAIKSWQNGFEPSKFYLLAWSFFIIGFILFLFRENGLIAINQFMANILQISSTITILFMSFALSKKINIYIEKRNEAQELALSTAIAHEKLISNQNQLLEAKVNQRTIDLEQTISTLSLQRKDLHEANNFKDKVFSIISHDLKSPISTLAGLLKLMKIKSLDELERAKVVENLEIALKNTKNLLDNILAWAHKNNRDHAENDEIDLYNTIEEILLLFQYQADLKSIKLINMVEQDFFIYANKNMLQLVLRNLISNAIKFTHKNGSVEISMIQDFPNVLIIVKDDGIGMSKQIRENLFKSNEHTSTPGTENEKGTGLGLMLCKEFLDKYNGALHVESKQGKGTTFTIILKNAIPILETVLN